MWLLCSGRSLASKYEIVLDAWQRNAKGLNWNDHVYGDRGIVGATTCAAGKQCARAIGGLAERRQGQHAARIHVGESANLRALGQPHALVVGDLIKRYDVATRLLGVATGALFEIVGVKRQARFVQDRTVEQPVISIKRGPRNCF